MNNLKYDRKFARQLWRRSIASGQFWRRQIPRRLSKGAFGEKTAFNEWRAA